MDDMINLFKILSDETRLRILVLLYHKKLCVCQLTGIMNESQPKISKHLAKLRDMGIIQDEREGQFIFYHLKINNQIMINVLQNIINEQKNYSIIKKDLDDVLEADKYIKKMKCMVE